MSALVIRDRDHVNATLDAACERLRQTGDRANLLRSRYATCMAIMAQVPSIITSIWQLRSNEERTDADVALFIAQLDTWLLQLDRARPDPLLAKNWPLEGVIGELEAARGLLRIAQCDIACPSQEQPDS